ncbi:MAG: S-layer protein [Candidatus Undinarchaeales archaeon]
MQGLWKKAGAALGSAIMIGSTLVGAALAQEEAMDLSDYQDLITSDGEMNGLYVVGADAATADVVTAMGMTAYAGNMQVAGEGGAEGEVSLTPISTEVEGVERHIEFDNASNYAYEFSSKTNTDVIGPEEYASDGVVDFLYSHNEKGPIYINGTEYAWREKVMLSLANLAAERDTVDSQTGDQYDEIVMPVTSQSMNYEWYVETGNISSSDVKGEKIWFMGKEYTVISVSSGTTKLGAIDSEVVLTTANPTTTIEGVDVTLGGIYSAGTSGAYEAKVTVTDGGTT